MATDGPAINVTSSDIGVSESSTTELGKSLQLISSGDTYDEFTWAGPVWMNFIYGAINESQTFTFSNASSLTLYDGPPNGASFITDPDTPNSQNTDISFVTSHFIMSTDAGGGTGSGGDGFIQWSIVNTNGNVTVDGGNVFTSNTGLPVDYITGLAAGETYVFTAELVDNNGAPLSPTVVFSFTAEIATYTDVPNLAALRTQTVDPDLYYRVTGSVINTHSISDYGLTMYFQDGTAAIMVNDSDYTTMFYNQGDALTNIRGHLELINGVLQLVPGSSSWGNPNTTGNVPGVSTVTIATLLTNWEDYESQLVNINGVTFADGDGIVVFQSSLDYSITDGSSSLFTPYTQSNYINQPIPMGSQNLVVIVSEFNGTVKVSARNLADFTLDTNAFELNDFKMYPNPTSIGYVNISSESNYEMKVAIFDILGKQVVSNKVINNRLDVSNLKAGIYIMKASQDDATTIKKLVIK
jgi:hypothetical protein